MPAGIPLPASATTPPSGSPLLCSLPYWPVYGGDPPAPLPDPTNCVVRPYWYDCDFAHVGGRLVVACVPHAATGVGGQLQVWQYDGALAPEPTTSVTLVDEDVYTCALVNRSSQNLDLFYRKGPTAERLYHRYSDDHGLTWSDEHEHTFGLDARVVSTLVGNTGATQEPLAIAYSPHHGILAHQMFGQVGGGIFRNWMVGAEWNTGTKRWDFSSRVQVDNSVFSTSNLWMAAVRNGDFYFRLGPYIQKLKRDGSHSFVGSVGDAIDEVRNLAILLTSSAGPGINTSPAPHYQWILRTLAVASSRSWGTPVLGWPYTPGSVDNWNAGIKVWFYNYNFPQNATYPPHSTTYHFYYSPAYRLKQRPDTVWEFLHPSYPDGELKFARCRNLNRHTLATWEV